MSKAVLTSVFVLSVVLIITVLISTSKKTSTFISVNDMKSYYSESEHCKDIEKSNDIDTGPSRAVVYRHNGTNLNQIPDFCTWTLPMDYACLQIPDHDPMPIFVLDIRDDPGLSGILKNTGTRDPANLKIVMNELLKHPDAGFLDFGSHISVYGLSIARALDRKVVAVDPMIENIMRVCKSTQLNHLTDKMTIVYNAISNGVVKIDFERFYNHIGRTTVFKKDKNQDNLRYLEHFSLTLDDMIHIVPFKTAVMKLDVEKSEYFAIAGGRRFLKEIYVYSILMEWYNIVTTQYALDLVNLMKELDYVPYIPYENGKHILVDYKDFMNWTKMKPLLDILWIKRS